MALHHEIGQHARTTGSALKNWFIAQTQDALAVAALWFVGLMIIGIPGGAMMAFIFAVLGGVFQFVPGIGAVLGALAPVALTVFGPHPERAVYILILYAVIAVVDGLWLQPYLMKRTTRVPIWASIIAPLVLGFLIPFWGVLLAAPLLAVVYAYKAKSQVVSREG